MINSLLTWYFNQTSLLSDLTKVNLFEFFEWFNRFTNFQNIIQITVHQTKASYRLAIKLGESFQICSKLHRQKLITYHNLSQIYCDSQAIKPLLKDVFFYKFICYCPNSMKSVLFCKDDSLENCKKFVHFHGVTFKGIMLNFFSFDAVLAFY